MPSILVWQGKITVRSAGLMDAPPGWTTGCRRLHVKQLNQPPSPNVMSLIPTEIPTHLAWQFEAVIPGHFKRDKEDYADIDFPILAPLPNKKAGTTPIEGASVVGPFVYFVVDRNFNVRYIGKTKEKTVVKRWVRPGVGGPATHYWTHTNKSAGCIRRIADGIRAGLGPFQLRFISAHAVPEEHVSRFSLQYANLDQLEKIEKGLMSLLRPDWNDPKTYR